MDETSLTTRSLIEFPEAVQSALGPFALEHDLRLVEVAPTRVRYESTDVFLNLYHGRQSYEIGVEVGALAEESAVFSLADVLAGVLGTDHGLRTYFQASNKDALMKCVEDIATLIDDHFGRVVDGDVDTWEQIKQATRDRRVEYTKKVVQQPVREAAQEAWSRRDYRRVCELYESIESDLTHVERARLAYALKQC